MASMTKEQIGKIVSDLLHMQRDEAVIRIGGMQIPDADKQIILNAYNKVYGNISSQSQSQTAGGITPAVPITSSGIKRPLKLTRGQYEKFNTLGTVHVLLILFLLIELLFAFYNLASLENVYFPEIRLYHTLYILLIVITLACAALFFVRNIIFIIFFSITAALQTGSNFYMQNYSAAIAFLIVSALFIAYLCFSARSAVRYKSAPIEVID